MIKAIILDVDGVISGDKKGYNWPDPHPDVVRAIKSINAKGIPVSLCTGRGAFGIHHFVELLDLNNPHIGDGGAVVIDVHAQKIIDAHFIPTKTAQSIVRKLQNHDLYLELYTIDGYMIQQGTMRDITQKHAAVLGHDAKLVSSLIDELDNQDIIKIMPIARSPAEKALVVKLFEPYQKELTLQWGTHPSADPYEFGIITQKGISKGTAALKLLETMNVEFEDVLGVGDNVTDWDFIELCGYAGAMGNASSDLKELVRSKTNSIIGGTVNENGLLDIFRYFELLE
ncbi:MAG: HAD family hydrolase [bacterium]|nr:HAD family hydrolase [bacterium]